MSRLKKAAVYSVFALIFVFGTVIYFVMRPDGNIITITSDGKVVEKIDLSCVSEEYETVVEHNGFNKVRIGKDSVAVIEADCPDKLCIQQSEKGVFPIVCLPHKLIINK